MAIVKRVITYALMTIVFLVVVWIVLKLLFPPEHVGPPKKEGVPPISILTEREKSLLVRHLDSSGMAPADYIISTFSQHDVIMLGEFHRIQHDPLFVQSLLPILHRHGIPMLGFEFANLEDQDSIDRLLNARTYDEHLALAILRRLGGGMFPWQEYLDVFKAAWAVNAALPEGVERFRVIALNQHIDGEKLNHGTPDERARETARLRANDSVMAAVIEREALQKSRKMLVYCGANHALTRFAQPMWNEETWTFAGTFWKGRTGQRLHRQYPGRIVTVILHSPQLFPEYQAYGLPFGGILDQVFSGRSRPVGFDVPGSPFATLPESLSVYSLGYGSIQFADYCDGYIMLDQIRNYRGVTFVPTWFDDVSFSDFKKNFITPMPAIVFHPLILRHLLEGDADMVEKFRELPAALEKQNAGR